MVCLRCKMAVQSVLDGLDIRYSSVELGNAALLSAPTPEQKIKINAGLRYYGLELMDNKKNILVEQIKLLIIELLNITTEPSMKFSEHISKNLHYDYTYLSNIFSEQEGSTIEKYYILYRIERVKELIIYEALSLKEISYQLNFSSVSHLCLQFKKITGEKPSDFKRLSASPGFIWRKV